MLIIFIWPCLENSSSQERIPESPTHIPSVGNPVVMEEENCMESDEDVDSQIYWEAEGEPTMDEICNELRSVVFPRLLKYRRFNKNLVYNDVYHFCVACKSFKNSYETGPRFGEFLTTLNYLEFVQRTLKNSFEMMFDEKTSKLDNALGKHQLYAIVDVEHK